MNEPSFRRIGFLCRITTAGITETELISEPTFVTGTGNPIYLNPSISLKVNLEVKSFSSIIV